MTTTEVRTTAVPYVPLTAMGFAAFVYVTFEIFTVGLITPMAADLGVPESHIGLLMSMYAGVVAVVTIPAMLACRRLDRRTLFLATLGFLLVGTILQATATGYGQLVIARIAAALTHGVFWSLVGPMAARLAPAGRTGTAVGLVSLGSTMALVLGSPAATWLGGVIGWRGATWALGLLAVASVAVLVPTLPKLPPLAKDDHPSIEAVSKWGVPSLIVFLLLAVTASFVTYTYLGLIVSHTAGAELVPTGLTAFGVFGLVGVLLATRLVDRRMIRFNFSATVLFMVAAVLGIAAFSLLDGGPTLGSTALIFLGLAVCGVGYGALPTVATTLFLHAGRNNQDTASALYVVTFQVGIASGSAVGATAVDAGQLPATMWLMLVLAAAATATLAAWSRPLLR